MLLMAKLPDAAKCGETVAADDIPPTRDTAAASALAAT
jgi:hypothetical protein